MIKKQQIIDAYKSNISSHLETGDYLSYFITTMFNMTTHMPDDVEGSFINQIKHVRKHDPSSSVLPALYKQLSDYRYKINTSLNHKIYEKDITLKRLNFVWNQYDILQTHIVKTLINNAGRSNKIDLFPKTYDFIDQKKLFNALFELADVWCPNIDEYEYKAFFETLRFKFRYPGQQDRAAYDLL